MPPLRRTAAARAPRGNAPPRPAPPAGGARSRRWGALALFVLASCVGPRGDEGQLAPPLPAPAQPPRVVAAEVDPELLDDLHALGRAVATGRDGAARHLLADLRSRGPSPRTRAVLDGFERVLAERDPATVRALSALQRAVEAHEDETARAILAALYARGPTGRPLELARAFERILDGREAVAALDMRLVAQPEDELRGTCRVWFHASSDAAARVVLRPGPASLRLVRTALDGREVEDEDIDRGRRAGAETTELEVRHLDLREPIALAPDESVRADLGVFALALPPGALAARCRVELELRSGEVVLGGQALPAARLRVEPAEIVRLAAHVPARPSEPAELEAYVATQRVHSLPASELAVRLPRHRRDDALERLAPHVERLPERTLRRLVPALRWLAAGRGPGTDPEAWRAWMRERRFRPAGLESSSPELRLPG